MKRLIGIAFALSMTACATTSHGPMQRILVDSNPRGAVIDLRNCGVLATDNAKTPAEVWVSRRSTECTIELSKLGYKPIDVRLSRRVAGQLDNNIDAGVAVVTEANNVGELLGGLIFGAVVAGTGMAIDGATGAAFEQTPNRVDAVLCPIGGDCAPEETRADAMGKDRAQSVMFQSARR